MLVFHYQNAGQKHNIKIACKSFGNVEESKYLGIAILNQKYS
jgi:phage gp16-like protein